MNYRLYVFKFKFIDDRYLFPIILNEDDQKKAKNETDFLNKIIEKLKEVNGLEEIKKMIEKADIIENLQKEFNSIMGEITFERIKTINIELREIIKYSPENVDNRLFKKFLINDIHLPIRKIDSFNDLDINPFIIIETD